jgi:hypothetical protein
VVAPLMGTMLYSCVLPWQGDAFPVIVPGCAGVGITVTPSVLAPPDPQLLSAVTITVPLLLPIVAVIVLDEELPFQPEGNVHV